MSNIILRPLDPTDRGYVLVHWVRAHSLTSDAFHAGPNYFPGMFAVCEAILDRSRCLVACAAKAPDVVLGFAVVEAGRILHYVYTRDTNRRDGIASMLLGPLRDVAGVRYSFLPKDHAVINGRLVVVEKKNKPTPPMLPIPSTWVYDPMCRVVGAYAVKPANDNGVKKKTEAA